MKKVIGLMLFLCMTGCACGRRATEKQLRQALADTNTALTQCRAELEDRQDQAQRMGKKMELFKKHVRR